MHHRNQSWAFLCAFIFSSTFSLAQDKSPVKFGKITPADFDLSRYSYDSSATAVVVADIGNSRFEGNTKGWFSLVFKRSRRVKVLSKKGFDAGTVMIPLYSDGTSEEKLDNLKAVTYNLENGNVTEAKLDEKSIFTDKFNKNIIVKKFSMPNLKEGSIIEYSYVLHSDFLFNLQPWTFQGEYPCLWSEYEVTIPEFFSYVFLGQGFQPYLVNSSNTSYVSYTVRSPGGAFSDDVSTITGSAVTRRWVMKDIPAIKEESFTTTTDNYVSKVEFQLSQYRFPNYSEDIMQNWPKASEHLMKDEYFGADIASNNGWLDNDLNNVIKGATSKLEKATKIYEWVHNTFTCSGSNSRKMDNTLKIVFKNKGGNEAAINLLLTAMLNHEEIHADPVLLSTRKNGYTHEIYPLLDRFNYVICSVNIDSKTYYLDASQPKLPFGTIGEECYNGHARIISKENPVPVYFFADSLKERKITTILIVNDEKGGSLLGSFTSQLGNVESYELREKISKKTEQEYFKDIKPYTSDFVITNSGIDSLNQLDVPATVHYDFNYKLPVDDEIIYLNPMLTEGYKENPFKSTDRKYPVEMPYTMDETYVFNMEIPNGYAVEELPKSARVSLNGTEGSFEYLIQKDESNIQMRTRLKLNKATFEPGDYSTLRDFFAFIVQKQAEQIVLKKKK
ncbi:MAG TPA: DUF3858 domain-containing protein [Puia sp.]|nr:DUF3858 domain-containing protein [Puia sp.]